MRASPAIITALVAVACTSAPSPAHESWCTASCLSSETPPEVVMPVLEAAKALG